MWRRSGAACRPPHRAGTRPRLVSARPATAAAVEFFVDVTDLEKLSGNPVRTSHRRPDEPNTLPMADAVVVAPATYNTINKWAAGISDTYALSVLAELTGMGTPIAVLPFVNSALAANVVFERSVAALRTAGVTVLLGPGAFEPHPPRTGDMKLDSYPWHLVLDAVKSVASV